MPGNVIDFFENIIDEDDLSVDAQARGGTDREYKRYFQARVDSDTFKSWEMKAYAETPKLYEYDFDGGGYVTNVNVTKNPRAKHRIFDIEVSYNPSLNLVEFQENPILRPARLRVDGIELDSTVSIDEDGNLITNAAGQIYNVTRHSPGLIFKIEKNIAAAPAAWFLNLASVVNSLEVTLEGLTFPARTLLMRKPTVGFIEREDPFSYRKAEIEIHYNTKGWHATIVNSGTVERRTIKVIDNTGNVVDAPITVPIADDNGDPVQDPVPLDEDGKALKEMGPDGKERISTSTTYRNTISYQLYPEIDFNTVFNFFFYNVF